MPSSPAPAASVPDSAASLPAAAARSSPYPLNASPTPWLLTAGGRDAPAPPAPRVSVLPDTGGLAIHSSVRFSGVKIGVVRSLELPPYLAPQPPVRLEMRGKLIFLSGIPSDSQTAISAET